MTILAVTLVAAVLVFAVVRPRGLPEIVATAPAAAVVLAVGLVTPSEAWGEVTEMAPTVGFLAAILVLAHLADAMGVFTWIAGLLRHRARDDPKRLLTLVFGSAALTTAVLSLDATVILLTPVVIATARSLHMDPRPHSYASAHLSNTASTLLPVSNLTNLIAFSATGLSFLHFATIMALPWMVSIVVELILFRLFFRRHLVRPDAEPAPHPETAAPTAALSIIAATLVGFAVSGFVGVAPAWVAAAGAIVLGMVALQQGRTNLGRIAYSVDAWFCAFVLILGVVVAGVANGPIGDWIGSRLPTDTTFLGLLLMAVVAAVAANLVNNLPATLLLLAALGTGAPTGLILAMLLGVNLGPNLTYVGSLAIMLWRRVAARAGSPPDLRTFTVLALATTPLTLLAAVTALWLVL
ncbi:SLC13 family permease [Rhodococcus marinonascens]|uniref:SLC13 family permease n=1 Tax=Rhodococcus marinonascens TaxID=38311 RepID=UPI000933B66C|nr:SLC13 family permease [Rhodococcus marinonascens]